MRSISSRAVARGLRAAESRGLHSLHRSAAAAAASAHASAAAACGRLVSRPSSSVYAPTSASSAAPSWSRRSAFSYPTSRTLDEIVKLPLLIPHTREEVGQIWRAHHADKGGNNGLAMADECNKEEYDTFVERAKKAPLFIVPCFKVAAAAADSTAAFDTLDTSSGFENMLVNVQSSSLLLTSLEEYKSRGASAASPFAVVTLYPDLAASHDLVLARAELMDVSVSPQQLMAMWSLLRGLYVAKDSAPFEQFAAPFNKKPNPTFDFEAYIQYCKQQASNIQLPKAVDTALPEDNAKETNKNESAAAFTQ